MCERKGYRLRSADLYISGIFDQGGGINGKHLRTKVNQKIINNTIYRVAGRLINIRVLTLPKIKETLCTLIYGPNRAIQAHDHHF